MTVSRRAVAITVAALVALAGMAITLVLTLGGSPAKPEAFTLKGTMYVAECTKPGYADLLPGAQVQVTGRNGEVIAVGTLEFSDAVTKRQAGVPADLKAVCTSTFSLLNIPAGRGLYGVHIGNGNRGVIWKSEDDARNGVDLSIGG
jgi:hypothetical protein